MSVAAKEVVDDLTPEMREFLTLASAVTSDEIETAVKGIDGLSTKSPMKDKEIGDSMKAFSKNLQDSNAFSTLVMKLIAMKVGDPENCPDWLGKIAVAIKGSKSAKEFVEVIAGNPEASLKFHSLWATENANAAFLMLLGIRIGFVMGVRESEAFSEKS